MYVTNVGEFHQSTSWVLTRWVVPPGHASESLLRAGPNKHLLYVGKVYTADLVFSFMAWIFNECKMETRKMF